MAHTVAPAAPPRCATTVFLLDDHELVRCGIRALLEQEDDIEVVGESGSADAALARLALLRPRVAVLDGRLRDGSGADACRRVRSTAPGTAVVVMMEEHDDDLLFGAIMAGAAAVVLRHVTGTALVDVVRRVATGQEVLDPAVTERVLAQVRRDPAQDMPTTHLTPQEEQVLVLLGRGMTNLQISEELGLVEKTVRNYVSTVLRKLGVESRTQAAVLAARRCHPGQPAAVRVLRPVQEWVAVTPGIGVSAERSTRQPWSSTSTS